MTAIFQRAFSRPSLVVAGFIALPAWAGVSLSLDSIRHPALEVDGLVVAFETGRRGEADIRVGRLQVAGIEYKDLAIVCEDFYVDLRRLECPRGWVRRADTRGRDRPSLPISFSYRFSDGALELVVVGADAVAWSPLVKRLRTWRPEGRIDLRLTADRRQAQLGIAIHKLKFSSKEGDVAGSAIDASIEAHATRAGDGWQWTAKFDWYAGEAYVAPWYRKAGVRATLAGTLDAAALRVVDARVDIAGVGGGTAGLRWDRARGEISDWAAVTDKIELDAAVREWLQPWLDQSGFPAIAATGQCRLAASWSEGHWQTFYAGLENVAVTDGTDYLHVEGMSATIPWQRGVDSDAEFSVAGGRLGDLPLGGFRIPAHLRNDAVSLAKLSIPLLDGHLNIDDLQAERADSGWQGSFSGGIEGVSMPKISAALKLPSMEGSFSARIPGARYADGVLALGGDMVIEVFAGRIVATGLEVREPLRAAQRVVAEVSARGLDLGMLTRTFAVGRIEGRFDADLRGLEMRGWQPVRFDGRIVSSPGDYRRSISRGALQDISSLGGSAGGAALMATPVRYSNTFGYERIGIGCRLDADVCRMDGLEPAGDGYLLVKGSGLPRVDVIGYNRSVDWNLLVSRIRAVIAGKSEAVVE